MPTCSDVLLYREYGWHSVRNRRQDEMEMELTRKELEAHDRLLENNLKISLLVEINEVLQQRQEVVQRHNLLLKNISDLQNQVQDTYKWTYPLTLLIENKL
ncbi:hypothetical protein J6590_060732 [Homalodisca vitripennis]|nr:hypothetical protein J6590_060732 [Homalodisca vitripennis]